MINRRLVQSDFKIECTFIVSCRFTTYKTNMLNKQNPMNPSAFSFEFNDFSS